MSDFEHRPGSGSIFKNRRKEKESHPDYRGTLVTPSGEKLEISCWVKKGRNQEKFFSCSIQEPYIKPENDQKNPDIALAADTDDLPF